MESIKLIYSALKTIIQAKGLLWQHTEFTEKYIIFSTDGPFVYSADVFKSGYEPIGIDDSANITDFEDNYKSSSNKSIHSEQQSIVQTIKPNYGSRAWTFSHNFCDKTTWFGDSIRVVAEAVGTGDGSTVTFSLAHTYVIDTTHGKITDENWAVPYYTQGGTTFTPEVKVNNVVKTERVFGQTSGGDFTIDYAAGTITFFTAPANSLAITATYYYSPANSGSVMYIRPVAGKVTVITAVECMLSTDIVMTDSIISAFFTYNPYLGNPPARFEYPGTRTYFKKIADFIAYTNGAYPKTPPFGGSTRGSANDFLQFRFEYVISISINDAYGAEMRVWLENHTPYTGEMAQITFYGYQL